jgi:rod shape-determining protein MreC
VLLLVAQLLLMSASTRDPDGSNRLEGWLLRLSWPVVAVAEVIGGGVRGAATGVGDLRDAHERIESLEAQTKRLRREVEGYREAALENRRLRRLLAMRDALVPHAIAASVVTARLDAEAHLLVIDRGRRDGVLPEMAAATWGGAVGRVTAVGDRHAKVRLLTDPSSGVGAVVQRSRVPGVVLGRGAAGLILDYVPRFSDVVHGDLVVTSGSDGIFPRGLTIGRVGGITDRPDGTTAIEVEPELDFRAVEEVLVIVEPVTDDGLLGRGVGGAP